MDHQHPRDGRPPPEVVPTTIAGGPTGSYLQLRALGGQGSGSRLNALNATRWAGDYTAAGIDAIQMDVRNFGPADLFLRLAFETIGAMGPTDIAFTTSAAYLPSGGDWMRVTFLVHPGALVAPIGSVATVLANTDVVRLYHSELPNVPNPINPVAPVNATLGVDNIAATAVPEPTTVALLGGGLLALAAGVRRRGARR